MAGLVCVYLACFFTPLSTSLLGIFTCLAVLCYLVSGRIRQLTADCKEQPALLVALLLFVFMAVTLSYTPAPFTEAIDSLKKYRELLLLPFMYALIRTSPRASERAQLSMIAGCTTLMYISYLMAAGVIPAARYGNSIVFHITHSFFMAILAFWSLNRATQARVLSRPFWILIFLAATFNLFYIAPGRTGMFVFICLMLLFLVQRLTRIMVLAGILLLTMITAAIFYTSDNFSRRIEQVCTEIKTYQPGHSRTSIGQRFDWWATSLDLIAEKPIMGHGVGSFRFAQRIEEPHSSVKPTDNPHNEYLFLTVQFGIVGFAMFCALMFLQFKAASRLDASTRYLLQGTLIALLCGCLMNSLLFDSQQGHFFLFMSAALMTRLSRQNASRDSTTSMISAH